MVFEKKNRIIYVTLVTAYCIFCLISGVDLGFALTILLWLTSVIYCVVNAKNRITLLMFMFLFFVFLLGAYFCDQFLGHSQGVVLFDKKITSHIYICLIIAIFGLLVGSTNKISLATCNFAKNNIATKSEQEQIVGKISLYAFYITYIPYIISEIVRVIFSITRGYESIYLNDANASLPYWFRLIAYMCPVFFYIFLASLPEKKKAKLPLILYLIYCTLSLLSGQRSGFVINLIVLFVYMFLRNTDDDIWISNKVIMGLCIIIPIIIFGLYLLGNIRFGTNGEAEGANPILSIFTSQGVSISVIGYGKELADSIPNKLYSFGGIIDFFQTNPISKALFGFVEYTGQSAERALNGNSFAHIISYLVLPWGYERGRGLGSSYVAETYHDFGYLGVFISSVVYGLYLNLFDHITKLKFWIRILLLLSINSFLMSPRGETDAFLSCLLNIQVFVAVFIIGIIYYYIKHKGSKIENEYRKQH